MFTIFVEDMSPRLKKNRIIQGIPIAQGYKPIGVPVRQTEVISIASDEFEALRLSDYEHLTQEDAAKQMGVSRPTFTRIYNAVRKKMAMAFVEGKSLSFERDENMESSRGMGLGRHNQIHFNSKNDECENEQSNQVKKCECMGCSYVMNAKAGISCRQLTCPQCGSRMKRKP